MLVQYRRSLFARFVLKSWMNRWHTLLARDQVKKNSWKKVQFFTVIFFLGQNTCDHRRCGTMFCRPCVLEWKEKKNSCTICEGPLEDHLVPVETASIIDRINSLPIKCPTCSQTIKRVERHCSTCGRHILERQLDDHISKCPKGIQNLALLEFF